MQAASLAFPRETPQPKERLCCPLCGESIVGIWLRTLDRFHLLTKPYELLRCPVCSLVWVKDPPEPSAMAAHYGARYHDGVTAAGEKDAERRWKEHVTQVRRLKAPGALLDIGCSSGGFLAAIKNDGWKLYGIEIDPEVAARARSRTGAVVLSGDAPSASFPPESFDVVTCFHVLEHQHRPLGLMAAVYRWLKPGGVFYVVVPNIDCWEARLFGSYWYGLEAPRHLYHFGKDSLCRCGREAGFQVDKMWTRSDCHVEPSMQYVLNELRERIHRPAISLAEAHPPTLAWKVMRKALRLTIFLPFRYLAAVTGNGASFAAVFKKAVS